MLGQLGIHGMHGSTCQQGTGQEQSKTANLYDIGKKPEK